MLAELSLAFLLVLLLWSWPFWRTMAVLWLLLYAFTQSLAWSLLIPTLGAVLRFMIKKMQQIKTQQLWEEQFLAWLQESASLLRTGLSAERALLDAGEDVSLPFQHNLNQFSQALSLGQPLPDAIHHISQDAPETGRLLFEEGIRLSHETGSSLAPLMSDIARQLQSQHRLQRELKALTAQGKTQAWMVSSLPFILALILSLLDHRFAQFWQSGPGLAVALVVITLQISAWFWIKRILNAHH